MKIFCIGRNYQDHAKEMNSSVPKVPMIFMKPPTALLRNNRPFYHPDFSDNIHYEVEVVLRICDNAKAVAPEFAARYYDAIGLGIDFTARDLQDACKANGHPWEIAKGFDNSAAISGFFDKEEFGKDISFQLKKNQEVVQNGNTQDMIFDFHQIISHITKYFKLNKGDLIYTGTPAGVGQVVSGDLLEGFLNGKKVLNCEIR